MKWDDIRFFLAVARCGSVGQAARDLGVNYTTVARRIELLERRLEIRLFERLPSGYAMTAAAETVFEEAVAMEERAMAFDRGLLGQDQRLSGRLRVSTSDAVATGLLIPELGRFHRAHPNIELEIATSDSVVNLDAREADIALRLTGAPPEHLIGKEIREVSYGVYATKRYCRKHGTLNQSGVSVLKWLSPRKAPVWIKREFSKARLGMKFDSPMAKLAAIKADLGIGALPDFIGGSQRGLVRVNKGPIESGWSLWILHHADLRATARLRAFRDFLVEVLSEGRASDPQYERPPTGRPQAPRRP